MNARHIPLRLWMLALLAAAGPACGTSTPAPVKLQSVSPSSGFEDEETDITIHGSGLGPLVETDFDDPRRSRVHSKFHASLDDVELTGVRLAGEGVLEATVPAGMLPGAHTLTVRTPDGRAVTSEAAFLTRGAWERAPFVQPDAGQLPTPDAGVPDDAAIEEDAALPDDAAVTADDASTPDAATVSDDASTDAGIPDDAGLTPDASLPDPAVELRFGDTAATLDPGACSGGIEVRVLDSSGAPVARARTLTLTTLPANAVDFFVGSACSGTAVTTLDVPPGDAGITFSLRAKQSGSVTLQAASAGLATAAGTLFVNPRFGPSVRAAWVYSPTRVRVAFSEPMDAAGLADASHFCIERSDGDPASCTPTSDFSLVRATALAGDLAQLELSAPLQSGGYTVTVAGIQGTSGAALGSPAFADLPDPSTFSVVFARPVGTTSIEVQLSQSALQGPDVAGSADCTSAAECGKRYRLFGPSTLGGVLSATVGAAPFDDRVTLTHANLQSGGLYTVVVANGVSGDGFDEGSFGTVRSGDGIALPLLPSDRAVFRGAGASISTLGGGAFLVDPFGDGSAFASVFAHGGRVYLGTNRTGATALRFTPEGDVPQLVRFALPRDLDATGGTVSASTAPGPYAGVGFTGCTANLTCGPDNEDGRGLFSSVTVAGDEWLVLGGARSTSGLAHVYVSRDADARLDLQYVDLSLNLGAGAKGLSAVGGASGRGYLGLANDGGGRPDVLNLIRMPASGTSGLDAVVNGASGAACRPALHDACSLGGGAMPGLGLNGTPANAAPVQIIDFFAELSGRLYLGNNGGLVRATTALPLDMTSSPSSWLSITPSAPSFAAKVSSTTGQTADLDPSQRAWTKPVALGGNVYIGRNTTSGPQLWRCNPSLTGSSLDCDSGDWSLLAANDATGFDPALSQFNDANNARISLVAVSGGALWVGYDNPVTGVQLYRSASASPQSAGDFQGEAGCGAGSAGCAGVGGNGLGAGAQLPRFLDAASIDSGGHGHLYLVVGSGLGPIRIYVQRS